MEQADLLMELNALRSKQVGGTNLTDEELRRAIEILADIRALRSGKSSESVAAKKAKAEPAPSAESFF